MNKFKVGDKVKNIMDGQVLTIKKIKGNSYTVEENVYSWLEEYLFGVDEIKKVEEQFEVGDVVYEKDSNRTLILLRKAWVVCYQDITSYEFFVEEGALSKTKTLQKITEKELANMGYVIKR